MLFFITPIIMLMSFLFTRLLHPLSMGLVLLLQTCLICISSGLSNQSFWFSYILFLIFLGGMLVLFIYVASLASNEPFKFSLTASVLPFLFIIFLGLFLMTDNLCLFSKIMISTSSLISESYNYLSLISMLYSIPTMKFTLYMVMYLLLTLFAIVKITSIHFGPLRLLT
uniref:NADH dehydrogenase subunit 6 n=1 Tax=Eiconaxius baja TaxID=2893296 RepID=UPI001EE0FF04|nr:NADH dehydrogenase subunit 6 [Eiconaxius baja]UIB39165.1 NADH dehydrogenase subunit 6 [Eiconaxius baja]